MTEQDAETLLDAIFMLDAQYQGGIIKARSRIDFCRRLLCPLLYAAIATRDEEWRKWIVGMGPKPTIGVPE